MRKETQGRQPAEKGRDTLEGETPALPGPGWATTQPPPASPSLALRTELEKSRDTVSTWVSPRNIFRWTSLFTQNRR